MSQSIDEGPKLLAFRLQNFMAYQDTDWLELRPITLIFGRNSSGKSALIRALRLMKHSLSPDADGQALRFRSLNGLNQGSFENTLHRGHTIPMLTYGFRCRLKKADPLHKLVNQYRQSCGVDPLGSNLLSQPSFKDAELVVGYWRNGTNIEAAQLGIECPWANHEAPGLSTLILRADRLEVDWEDMPLWPETSGYTVPDDLDEATKEELATRLADAWHFTGGFALAVAQDGLTVLPRLQVATSVLPFLTNLEEGGTESYNTADNLVSVLTDMVTTISKDFFSSLDHIGPIRPAPERVYVTDHTSQARWAESGMRNFARFLEDQISLGQTAHINMWLSQLKLGVSVVIEKCEPLEGTVLSSVGLHESEESSTKLIRLVDTGYGVSQVLPIIVQTIATEPGQTVIIEQPELHLHPGAQATLADLFIDNIFEVVKEKNQEGKEETKRRSRTTISVLETHSEQILLRLLTRVAETSAGWHDSAVKPSKYLPLRDLAIYFVNRNEDYYSEVSKVKIAPNGDIAVVPEGFGGFFADDKRESLDRARARRAADQKRADS